LGIRFKEARAIVFFELKIKVHLAAFVPFDSLTTLEQGHRNAQLFPIGGTGEVPKTDDLNFNSRKWFYPIHSKTTSHRKHHLGSQAERLGEMNELSGFKVPPREEGGHQEGKGTHGDSIEDPVPSEKARRSRVD
jgi:hypothetical protein